MSNIKLLETCTFIPCYKNYIRNYPDLDKYLTNFIRDITIDLDIPVHHAAKLAELLTVVTLDLPSPEVVLTHTPSYLIESKPYNLVLFQFKYAYDKLMKLIKEHPIPDKVHFPCMMIIDQQFGLDYNEICYNVYFEKKTVSKGKPDLAQANQQLQSANISFDADQTLNDLRWAYMHVARGDLVDLNEAPTNGARFWFQFAKEYPTKFADIIARYLLPRELDASNTKEDKFYEDNQTLDLAKSLLDKIKLHKIRYGNQQEG